MFRGHLLEDNRAAPLYMEAKITPTKAKAMVKLINIARAASSTCVAPHIVLAMCTLSDRSTPTGSTMAHQRRQ